MILFLKNVVFTVVVPGTTAVYLPLWLVAGREAASGVWRVTGTTLIACGVALYLWSAWCFARLGRGTPAPIDEPKTLVDAGPYRFSRNPMYVAVLTTVFGWAFLFRAPVLLVYALGLWSLFYAFVRLYEEPHLRRSYGEQYDRYCRRVRRWL